jgi:hypothetical protein
MCKRDAAVCLSETNNSIEMLVQNKNKVQELEKMQGQDSSIVEESQTLLPIIKRLLQMLKDSPNDQESTLLQIWTLTLRSLRTVDVHLMV